MKNPGSNRLAGSAGAAAATTVVIVSLAACAGPRQRFVLEPGIQLGEAEIDVETGSVAVAQEGVAVTVQGAMLPSPRGETLHPTFWVTVRNDREEQITVRPSDARLIDTFGNQLPPPGISTGPAETLDFELVFEQILVVDGPGQRP